MKYEPEKNTSVIELKNEPKLSEHEADKIYNERRIALVPYIKDFVSKSERWRGKDVSITFVERGVSSLVSIIETGDEKVILKIPLGLNFSDGESIFLRTWEVSGVKVPHVIEDGVLNGHSYILMEYIDAPRLEEIYTDEESLQKNIPEEMGRIFHNMHKPVAEGYGRVMKGKAEYREFKLWLNGSQMKTMIDFVEEKKLLTEEHGSLELARKILLLFIKKEAKSSYCHEDFGASNVFATKPFTVFDPNPVFNHAYYDLGRSIVLAMTKDGGNRAVEQLIKGYFDGKPYNKKALQSFILINAYMKFPYWYKTKRTKLIAKLQEYLIKTKHLLED
ncbi:MAG: phosphotransferase [Candidatus Paceibacterota bacterium]